MTTLQAALARMLDDQGGFWSEDHTDPEADAASMLDSDTGQALAALVDAAVAWAHASPFSPDWMTEGDERGLTVAVERWEELTRG